MRPTQAGSKQAKKSCCQIVNLSPMLFHVPRRRPHQIGNSWVSFASLTRVMPWPQALHRELWRALMGEPIPQALQQLLLQQNVLAEQEPEDVFFPLTQFESNRWANSSFGRSMLSEVADGPLVILDTLNWSDLSRLPSEGALLYLGDLGGGFWASKTAQEDGSIPCPRCLALRYLAGRQAAPDLYRALRQGATVGFDHPRLDLDLLQHQGLVCFGPQGRTPIERVLPLPDCESCLARSAAQPLNFGPFSPVTKLNSEGSRHSARVCQTLWLCDTETVGHGGSYDPSPERGQARAVNEALERYAAHFLPVSVEPEGVRFESSQGTRHFSLQATLLREPGSVSTGLACRDSLELAISDALAEICERDALARFWLDLQEENCQVVLLEKLKQDGLELEVWQLDSFHQPTVLCLGRRPDGGVVTGSACGAEPLKKALAECLQNAAYLTAIPESDLSDPPESFDHHLRFYWNGRFRFPDLDCFQVESLKPRPLPSSVYHCDLTPPDLELIGRKVVRVQVPGLLYLPMSHHDWPEVLKETRRPPQNPHPFG